MVLATPTKTLESPITRVLSLISTKSYGRGYTALCPAHRDSDASLMIWENEDGHVGLMCFAGCARKAICEAMGITEQALYVQDGYKPRRRAQSLDLIDLMESKCIDYRKLLQWGIVDGYTWNTPKGKQWKNIVRIPYYNLDGSEYSNARIRTTLTAKNGTYWEKEGESSIPYGLEQLVNVHDALAIVEGESDVWTLRQWGFHALGIPGAGNTNTLQAEHIKLFPEKVYVMEEPDDAGKKFVSKVSSRLYHLGYKGKLYCLSLQTTHAVKDPNALNQLLFKQERPKDFITEWQKALQGAALIDCAPEQDRPEQSGMPEIVIGGQLRDSYAEALQALVRGEKKHPSIFVQSGRLIQLAYDEKKHPIIRQIGVSELRNALTCSADYFRTKSIPNSDDVKLVPVSPPKELAESILALKPHEWPFPALEAVVEMPVMRADGSILDTHGYDEATKLYYAPDGNLGTCKIPDQPTKDDICNAVAFIEDVIGEFPYAGLADKANTYGLLFTPFVRPVIKRHIPLAIVNAPKPGTGKGLLCDTVAIAATGETAAILAAPDSEEEWSKQITAMLIQGRTNICIDNIPGKLQSSKLEGVLTATIHEGRVLGQSTMVKVPNRATWMATGNNIKLGGDLPRRCYEIRLDPQVSQPWLRTGFKHEELATYVTEHRSDLINAILTIARAWFIAGQPINDDIPSLGTFTSWAKTIGSILSFAGVQGFLGNLQKLYSEADEDSRQWENFLYAWQSLYKDTSVTVQKITDDLKSDSLAGSDAGSVFLESLPDYLQMVLNDKPNSFKIRLGKQLEKRIDTCYGSDNLHLKRSFDKHTKTQTWTLLAGSAGSEYQPTRSENIFSNTHDAYRYTQNTNDASHSPHSPQSEKAPDTQKTQNGSTSGLSNDSTLQDKSTLPARESHSPQEYEEGEI